MKRFLQTFDALTNAKDWDKMAMLVDAMLNVIDESIEECDIYYLLTFSGKQYDQFQALAHSYIDPVCPSCSDCELDLADNLPDDRAYHLWYKALVESNVGFHGAKKVCDMLVKFIDEWVGPDPEGHHHTETVDEILDDYNKQVAQAGNTGSGEVRL